MGKSKSNEVRLSGKLWLAAADSLCSTMCGLVTGGGMTYFYTRWMNLDTNLAAIVWLIFGVWNAVNDPLFGFISDHTKAKSGRRIPFIRYGAPFYAIVFILIWTPFLFGKSQPGLFVQMLAMLFLFDALYTAIATALYVMPYEMTVDNKVRGSIFICKILFGVISLAAPLILMPMIEPEPGADPSVFRIVLTVIGIVSGAVIFFSTYFYHELEFAREEEQPGFVRSLIDCFKNKPFLIFEIISFTTMYINTSLMQGVLYYFDELKVSMVPCYVSMVAGAVTGLIFYSVMQSRIGVRTCMLVMCLTFGLGCLAMAFFGGILPIAVAGFFLAGTGYAGCMFVVPLMNGDVIDYDETVTGLRREGMYAGVNSFITKPAVSLAQAAFLWIWKAAGYDPTLAKGSQSAAADSGLLIAWMLIPGILLVICAVSMKWYPLYGEKWAASKKEIEKKHIEKSSS